MKIIEAPKENVAQNVLMIVSTATTKIKQEITKSVAEGIDQEELTKTLNKIIAEYCKRIDNLEPGKRLENRSDIKPEMVLSVAANSKHFESKCDKQFPRRHLYSRYPEFDVKP